MPKQVRHDNSTVVLKTMIERLAEDQEHQWFRRGIRYMKLIVCSFFCALVLASASLAEEIPLPVFPGSSRERLPLLFVMMF